MVMQCAALEHPDIATFSPAQVDHALQRCKAVPTASTMPSKWPNELYDYVESKAVHEDIESLDLDEGKWFKCKCCKNQKDQGSFISCPATQQINSA